MNEQEIFLIGSHVRLERLPRSNSGSYSGSFNGRRRKKQNKPIQITVGKEAYYDLPRLLRNRWQRYTSEYNDFDRYKGMKEQQEMLRVRRKHVFDLLERKIGLVGAEVMPEDSDDEGEVGTE